ncbi:hypothetical protein MYX65_08265 [Acidobacteria bacterium AH-259-L09]|nr:hypothetical protein [Acidobacteria bacterium AH-259-L09]
MADAVAKIGPYADSITSWFSRLHQDISYLPEGGFNPKSFPLVLVVAFQVHESKVTDFLYSARKFHAALQKANWPNYYFWSQVVAGGEGPLFNLVLPKKNWAGLTPPEKPFPAVLEEVLGRQEAESLIETFDGTIRSSRSDILRYRPDLSYVPSGQ